MKIKCSFVIYVIEGESSQSNVSALKVIAFFLFLSYDLSYHIYCVGLRKVPSGRWHCPVCAICWSCGTREPSCQKEEDRQAEWFHEVNDRHNKNTKKSKF